MTDPGYEPRARRIFDCRRRATAGAFRAAYWKDALNAGAAPRVVLRATHQDALLYVALDELKRRALDLA